MSLTHGPPTAVAGRVRVLVYDDHDVYRVGLRVVLQSASDLVVVGDTNSTARAMVMSEQVHPHVVLVSNQPKAEVLALISGLRRGGRQVISIGHGGDEPGGKPCLDAGASIHLGESVRARQIIDAVRAAAAKPVMLDRHV